MKRSYKLIFILICAMCLTCFAPAAAFAASSTNSYAKSISSSGGTLSPRFSKSRGSYFVTTAAGTTKVVIKVARSNSHAKTYMHISGYDYCPLSAYTVKLAAGHSTYLYIKVIAQNRHHSRTYRVKITRKHDSTALAIGDSYQGGKIAYIDGTGRHGLIAATTNQSTRTVWAVPTYQWTAVPGGTSTELGSGASNTDKIIDQNGMGTTYAAGLASAYRGGGYADWYLPSKDELNKLYLSKTAVGGFARDVYLSSSEGSPDEDESEGTYTAWAQFFGAGDRYFDAGEQYLDDKGTRMYVRAVRTF